MQEREVDIFRAELRKHNSRNHHTLKPTNNFKLICILMALILAITFCAIGRFFLFATESSSEP